MVVSVIKVGCPLREQTGLAGASGGGYCIRRQARINCSSCYLPEVRGNFISERMEIYLPPESSLRGFTEWQTLAQLVRRRAFVLGICIWYLDRMSIATWWHISISTMSTER